MSQFDDKAGRPHVYPIGSLYASIGLVLGLTDSRTDLSSTLGLHFQGLAETHVLPWGVEEIGFHENNSLIRTFDPHQYSRLDAWALTSAFPPKNTDSTRFSSKPQ